MSTVRKLNALESETETIDFFQAVCSIAEKEKDHRIDVEVFRTPHEGQKECWKVLICKLHLEREQ